MAKKNNLIIGIIVIAAIIILSRGGLNLGAQAISPSGAFVERDLPSQFNPNQEIDITLTANGVSGDYFAIVREDIPSGWTHVSGGSIDGNQVKVFLTNLIGGTITYRLRAPSTGTSVTFSGTYQFSSDPTALATEGDTTITSCNPNIWTPSPAQTCSDQQFTQTNDCGSTRSIAGTKGPRNTAADTNCDSLVLDSELLLYAQQWLNNQISDIQLLQAAEAWLGGQ